jgi:hypothetical protein
MTVYHPSCWLKCSRMGPTHHKLAAQYVVHVQRRLDLRDGQCADVPKASTGTKPRTLHEVPAVPHALCCNVTSGGILCSSHCGRCCCNAVAPSSKSAAGALEQPAVSRMWCRCVLQRETMLGKRRGEPGHGTGNKACFDGAMPRNAAADRGVVSVPSSRLAECDIRTLYKACPRQ